MDQLFLYSDCNHFQNVNESSKCSGGWVVSKFALHPKIDSKDVTVTYNGKNLEEEEKNRFTDYFNEALFLERNHIFRGMKNCF